MGLIWPICLWSTVGKGICACKFILAAKEGEGLTEWQFCFQELDLSFGERVGLRQLLTLVSFVFCGCQAMPSRPWTGLHMWRASKAPFGQVVGACAKPFPLSTPSTPRCQYAELERLEATVLDFSFPQDKEQCGPWPVFKYFLSNK